MRCEDQGLTTLTRHFHSTFPIMEDLEGNIDDNGDDARLPDEHIRTRSVERKSKCFPAFVVLATLVNCKCEGLATTLIYSYFFF